MNRKRRVKRVIFFGLISLIVVAIALAVVTFSFGPSFVAKRFNPIDANRTQPISEAAQTLHKSLAIADLHADSLLWGSDLSKLINYGHVDIPRLIQGNVALQVFTSVTKVPAPLLLENNSDRSDDVTKLAVLQRWSIPTWFSLSERALYQARRLKSFESSTQGKFKVIASKQDLSNYLAARQRNVQITAGLLGLEGAHALEGKIENVDRFYKAGFRLIGLAHFFDNDVSGSAHGIKKGGLTSFGREVVRLMESRHMIIDLAHASSQTIDEVLDFTNNPVLVSHTGVQGTCSNARNLSDRQIQQIAQHKGVIGIGFWKTATCGNDAAAIARAIRYATDLVGVNHVALGSDFDGAVRLPFDVADMVQVTNALLVEGFSKQEIEKIMGLNVLNLLQALLPEK
ncbi:membrane dipeptidase [Leptolyngbya sp. FACHB-321]|uniref:dipeptidase n=1 Tax=Leptolyngbya sp. FACHB-321 TaxID=2692807 RepID=UPI001683F581|nr:membrane dipeptidase [Leptolyngbya sp. FACHB-321]MBD2038949.1 membrane dipeptidase [Leptolyngbya sp. FACHB-321]